MSRNPFRFPLFSLALLVATFAPTRAHSGSVCTDYSTTSDFVGTFVFGTTPPTDIDQHSVGADRVFSVQLGRLWSFDVTDRSSPVPEQALGPLLAGAFGVSAREVAANGDGWVYVAAGRGSWAADSLLVYDASTPAALTQVGALSIPSLVEKMEVQGSRTYLAGELSLTILDVSSPGAPAVVGSVALAGNATGVAVNNGYAYVATPGGIIVVDVEPPGSASVVGPTLTVAATDIAAAAGYAYAVDAAAGFSVLDLSAPQAPVLLSQLPAVTASAVRTEAAAVYVAAPFREIDVSDPFLPVAGNALQTAPGSDFTVLDGRIYLSLPSNINAVLDLTGNGTVEPACGAAFPQPGWEFVDMVQIGTTVIAMERLPHQTTSFLVSSFDVSDPTSPVPLRTGGDSYSGGEAKLAMDPEDPASGYVFTLDTQTLRTWDVSVPASPVIVSQFAIPFNVDNREIETAGSFAYCAGFTGLDIVDVADPAAPVARGSLPVFSAGDIAVEGNLACLVTNADIATGDYALVDISDPDAPAVVHQSALGQPLRAVDMEGQTLYITNWNAPAQLFIYDISSPAAPSLIGTWTTPYPAAKVYDLQVRGPVAYLATNAGVAVVDVSNPALPTGLGGFWAEGEMQVVVPTEGLLLLAPGFLTPPARFFLAPIDCAGTPVPVPISPGESGFTLHAAAPNPFRDRTVIDYDLPRAAEIDVSVYSVSGRRVRVLAQGSRPAGAGRVTWDGSDEKGRRVAAGVWFIRLRTVGAEAVDRVVRIR